MSDAARFLDGLRRQRDKYRAMAAAAADQQQALERSDMDGLLAVVERKRGLLAEIEALEKDVAPLRARWDELRAAAGEALGREIEAAVVETRDVLQALVKQEDEGRRALERQRQASADGLQDLLRRSKARNAYKP